ncbi:DUF2530 domain-containing protein [Actinomadura harenae]|uniref:DUF2530 domain-containing protein n=1 Tax=Actinomadura harenae TaxID=2483351 RepID=A0A3M2LGP7_9ACTN|nr:DUF2530 domain-containing protein [Actinomadura harenae]RMI33918.1 DUF2530 domain-containing protein [Actinomadura harenae]
MSRPRRPDPQPLATNDVHIAIAGTVAWAVALAVLLVVGLPSDERWWLWVCAVGIGCGLFAIWYIPRLQAARARLVAERAAERDAKSNT